MNIQIDTTARTPLTELLELFKENGDQVTVTTNGSIEVYAAKQPKDYVEEEG